MRNLLRRWLALGDRLAGHLTARPAHDLTEKEREAVQHAVALLTWHTGRTAFANVDDDGRVTIVVLGPEEDR